MDLKLRGRLSVMMFIQFFVWGAWWVPLGAYLSHNGFDAIIGQVFATQGYAAILAPLFIGAIADRYFAAQKVMGVLHLVSAVALFWFSTLGPGTSPNLVIFAAMCCMIAYMPTLPLVTTVGLNAVADSAKDFPAIRVFGTLGWIVAGLLVGFLKLETTNLPILLAAGASVIYGLYSFTLPNTPPRAEKTKPSVVAILGLDALKGGGVLFQIFIVASLVTCVPLAFYYAYTSNFLTEAGVQNVAAIMTLGQVSETLFLLAMPFLFLRLGIKWVMVVGMVAWALRFAAFSFGLDTSGNPVMWLLLLGIVLHGICYDFFFVAGQIYVDRVFGPETRARAQSFLALITLGVGAAVGSLLANSIYVSHTVGTVHDWKGIWLIPAGMAAVTAVVFALIFKDKVAAGPVENISPPTH